MCTKNSYVFNKYDGHTYFVPCRDCECCQIENSRQRYSRLLNHVATSPKWCLFVTLNYSNQWLPYIKLDEIQPFEDGYVIDVWRSASRQVVGRTRKKVIVTNKPIHLESRFIFSKCDYRRIQNSCNTLLRIPTKWQGEKGAIGVCLSSDFTNFIKRFKKNYYSIFNQKLDENLFSYYRVSEYGPTTMRPHFHTLLYFDPSLRIHEQAIRNLLVQAWPFCSLEQMSRNIETAIKPQQYVSLYTVRPTNLSPFYKVRYLSAKSSYSTNFGFGNGVFSFPSIQALLDMRTISQVVSVPDKKTGLTRYVNVPIPQYIARRYFPKFTGYSKLSTSQILNVLLSPSYLYTIRSVTGASKEVCKGEVRRLKRAFLLTHFSSRIEYAYYYNLYQSLRKAYTLQRFYLNHDGNFDGNYDVIETHTFLNSLRCLLKFNSFRPNEYMQRQQADIDAHEEYLKHMKVRKMNDYCNNLQHKYLTFQIN